MTEDEYKLFCELLRELKSLHADVLGIRKGLERVNWREMAIKNPWQI